VAIFRKACHRCHGEDGAIEGGLNYLLDRDKLVARGKIVPGQPSKSRLFRRVAEGSMPPAGQKPRPTAEEIDLLRQWIQAGAPSGKPHVEPALVSEATVLEWVLADLDKRDRRARRFTRYFSLVPLHNAGHGPDELGTCRHALGKLLNSLSWHPRISLPEAIDARGLVLRIDLRDYQLDANLWNRLLADYPYGILQDTGVSRAVLVGTATRMPVVRADWFVATASRPPLYYELLQIPSNLADLERQLRVDVTANIQQERVARLGFNGSGVSKNNRILERHDAMNGAYWRTYDFEAVPQNLLERNILLPDRRNVFAYPLGPGLGENGFQHAGGEVIFNLPNGLQGYVLVNAGNVRVDRGPTAIVSDPKRPDRAVEAGLSCMHCHATGILPKDDQLREHVRKNRKAFSRADVDLVEALYPPAKKMRKLMEEDASRFARALAKTGNKATAAEVVMAITLRYEADVDLATLAAEVGVRPADLQPRLAGSENLARSLGALKLPGATVARQVVVQAFADLVREMKLGIVLQPGQKGESLPDATGEVDPLEAQSHPANAIAFRGDSTLAAFAGNDRSVRIQDVEAGRDLRRCIGHTASVWCVAFSPDGTRLLSGGKDGTVRLWETSTGRELLKLDAHLDLVSALVFAPDGKRALSAGYDHEVILWDLQRGERVAGFSFDAGARYLHAVAFAADGKLALACGERTVYLFDAATGKLQRKLEGHAGWVTAAALSPDGKQVASASDDGTARHWDAATGKQIQAFRGHDGPVKTVALSRDGRAILTGGSDATVRLWDAASGKQLRIFRKHTEPLVAVAFSADGTQTWSGSRDGVVLPWSIAKSVPSASVPRVKPVEAGPVRLPEMHPEAVIPVGGTVGRLLLWPERSALYYFDLTNSTLGRINTLTLRRERVLKLPEGVDAISNGPPFVALTRGPADKPRQTTFQVIDAERMKVRKTFRVPIDGYDIAVCAGSLVLVSGGGAEWSEVSLIDLDKGAVAGTRGGVWGKSLLCVTPDGRRLYVSSQGVMPGTLDAFTLPARRGDIPVSKRAANHDKLALGGEIDISPDGRFALCRSGTILRLSPQPAEDMQLHVKVEAFVAAAIDTEGGTAYLLARDGTLREHHYPSFRLRASRKLSLTGYRMAVDAKAGQLYVAGFDAASVAAKPRAKGHGDIHVYSLR
jgi:WD40 repeat protein